MPSRTKSEEYTPPQSLRPLGSRRKLVFSSESVWDTSVLDVDARSKEHTLLYTVSTSINTAASAGNPVGVTRRMTRLVLPGGDAVALWAQSVGDPDRLVLDGTPFSARNPYDGWDMRAYPDKHVGRYTWRKRSWRSSLELVCQAGTDKARVVAKATYSAKHGRFMSLDVDAALEPVLDIVVATFLMCEHRRRGGNLRAKVNDPLNDGGWGSCRHICGTICECLGAIFDSDFWLWMLVIWELGNDD
ncbi:uncharacterized protein BXZ73DRAFT_105989 [Epithele typhae]|uniref:uncharacterized protein n=1 Tax=Epithele typhae TaxID=378194 RepID=UPI00200779E1|nr:uncharacterized protein BXZ73DRAFT_105989 [Epithele typhae]KAH9915923.1 hypothetical protein BXZ73DRAFT_105989 [Epithele typhae]